MRALENRDDPWHHVLHFALFAHLDGSGRRPFIPLQREQVPGHTTAACHIVRAGVTHRSAHAQGTLVIAGREERDGGVHAGDTKREQQAVGRLHAPS